MVVGTGKSYGYFVSICLTVVFISLIAPQATGEMREPVEIPVEAVSMKVMDNGLTILAKRSRPDKLVAVDVKIRAGESTEGEYLGTGISHLVEHMVFKGTSSRGVGDIEREVKSYGGIINGSVSKDMTDYRIVLPSKYFPQALSILSDMLLNATFDNKELAKEKEVILNEINLNEDEPQSRLIRLLHETAYLRHPYKYPPIGYREPFRALTREDALRYYNRMYSPNRIIVTIVGDIDEDYAISLAEGAFRIFRPPDYRAWGSSYPEPRQITTRRAEEEKSTPLAYLAIGFHSTGLLDSDLFAMDVLSILLGRGDNSRLNKKLLKEDGVVYSVSAWNYTPAEPGLFVITAILDKDNLEYVEKAVTSEIEALKSGEIDEDELESARNMILADHIAILQTVDGQADAISLSYALTGNYDFSRKYVIGVQAVSAEDVKRVANKYLRPENMTVARIVPKGYAAEKITRRYQPAKDEIKKVVLSNGLRVLVREDHKVPSAFITVAMLGGLAAESSRNNGISNLTARMLLKGTEKRDESQIKGYIERLGGKIDSFSGFNAFGVTVEVLKPNVEETLELIKDIIKDSDFPQEEIDKEKSLIIAAMKEEDDDIFQDGLNKLRADLFGSSPYAFRYLGSEDTINSLTRSDLVSFYKNYCVSNNMVLSVSGDVDATQIIETIK
ncbi:MAG: insulinase family protein, partial [Candidatus Omnitrophica bacterium]|nr:insulinase family protein [Candidatus Omnitrophota bacterium]